MNSRKGEEGQTLRRVDVWFSIGEIDMKTFDGKEAARVPAMNIKADRAEGIIILFEI